MGAFVKKFTQSWNSAFQKSYQILTKPPFINVLYMMVRISLK